MAGTASLDKTLSRGRKAAKAGDWLAAFEAYQNVLDRFAGNKKAIKGMQELKPAVPDLLQQAQAAQKAADWTQAERLLNAAFGLAPETPQIGIALAATQLEISRAPGARTTALKVLKHAPGNPEALNFKGRAERTMGLSDAAEASFKAALGHPETDAQTLNNLGVLARAQGALDQARAYYEQALALAPDNVIIHRNLAQLTSYTADHPHLMAMRALAEQASANDTAKAPLHFALFHALDKIGAYDEAFAHLETANALARKAAPYDFQTDAIPTALGKALIKGPIEGVKDTPADRTPIFVTGLPRSGTTLVERILSRAQGTQACGELSVVQTAVSQLLRDVMARDDKPLKPADIAQLRDALRQGLAEYSDGSPIMIDKMPLNFEWIGFICAALPEAKVIHIARDPMAVAWSLYRMSFEGAGNGFVYAPGDIARYMVLHRDIMAHWRSCFPDRICDISYEDLIAEPENTTKAIAGATELAWSADWLSPEKAKSQVLTASAEQVRQPIYQDSNAQWKRYEAALVPLRQALVSTGILADDS